MTTPVLLIVDDEATILSNLADFFEDEGYRVYRAESGERGMELLQQHTLDLAIVDMRLPGMDGNIFIKNARQLFPDLPVLIHTGSTDYTLPAILQDLNLTSEHILFKPVKDMSVFAAKVAQLIEESNDK